MQIKDSDNIERAAVNCITDAFLSSTRLKPYIPIGDKEPVWDGNIYISHGNKSKSRIPTQVKGKVVKKLPNKPTYPITITNLHNYKRDGGVIYFVVYLIGEKRYPFFKLLAPIDLKRYIKQANGNSSISVNLDPFDTLDSDLENQIIQFFYDCKKQTSFAGAQILSLEEAIKKRYPLNYTVHGIEDEEEAYKYLTTHYTYLYANVGNKENPVFVPVGDQPYMLSILPRIHQPVKCGGTIYFNDYQDGCNGLRREITLGDFLRLKRDKKSSKLDFNFKVTNLHELANQLSFAYALCREGEFFIGDECVKLPGIEKDRKFQKDIKNNYLFWDGFIKTLLELNCDLSKIDASAFNNKDFDNLRLLKRVILDKEEIAQNNDISGVTTMEIGPYKVLLFAEKLSNGKYKITDFFKLRERNIFAFDANYGEKYSVSIFSLVFQRDDVDSIINLDYDNFIKSYEEAAMFNRYISTQANQDVLAMISTYDKSKQKDKRFLAYALKLIDWIIRLPEKEENCWYIYQLNKFQIIKRLNSSFTDTEKDSLLELADGDVPTSAKWAANLLLEDYSRSDRLWKQLTEKEKEEHRKYPIFWFEQNRTNNEYHNT